MIRTTIPALPAAALLAALPSLAQPSRPVTVGEPAPDQHVESGLIEPVEDLPPPGHAEPFGANILFYPNSAVLAGMDRWPASFFAKGLWYRAESVEGPLAAYRRIPGLKEVYVARGPHSIDMWTPSMLDRLADLMVTFATAVIQNRTEVPGAARWDTLRDLVSTTADDLEPSSRPTGPSVAPSKWDRSSAGCVARRIDRDRRTET